MRGKARGMTDSVAPRVVVRPDALAAGWSDREIRGNVRRGEWQRLQRGAYLLDSGTGVASGLPLDRAQRHGLTVAATVPRLTRPAVISHVSAAAVHGLALWRVPTDRVHVTRNPPATSHVSGRLRVHSARLDERDIVLIDAMVVTSVARTLVDLAGSVHRDSAVVACDHALREGLVDEPELRDCLDRHRGRKGSRSAARAIAEADRRSGSVGETRSRLAFRDLGLPVPELQIVLRDARGRHVATCDFGWREHGVIGEFDGRVKYGRLLRPGQQPGDVVFEEKRREDAIRELDWQVFRWVWPELDAPPLLARRFTAASERAARLRRLA